MVYEVMRKLYSEERRISIKLLANWLKVVYNLIYKLLSIWYRLELERHFRVL